MMDMCSRNQYLKQLRTEYLETKSKKRKSRLLNEAEKRTALDRKYLIKKLRPISNLDKRREQRRKKKEWYDGYFKASLVKIWEIFDFACGQRLKTILTKEIIEKLRKDKELVCSDEVAKKLTQVSARTIDGKLRHQKEVLRQLQRKGQPKQSSLLLNKVPIKIHGELDSQQIGNLSKRR